jgi:hypothetical protein
MLNKIPFSTKEKVFHGLHVIFKMKLIHQNIDEHNAHLFMSLA